MCLMFPWDLIQVLRVRQNTIEVLLCLPQCFALGGRRCQAVVWLRGCRPGFPSTKWWFFSMYLIHILWAKPFTILNILVPRRNGWHSAGRMAPPCLPFQFPLDDIDQKLSQNFTVLVRTGLLEPLTRTPSPHSHPQQSPLLTQKPGHGYAKQQWS